MFIATAFIILLLTLFAISIKSAMDKQANERKVLIDLLRACPELPSLVERHQALLRDARDVLNRVHPDDTCHDLVLLDLMEDALRDKEE